MTREDVHYTEKVSVPGDAVHKFVMLPQFFGSELNTYWSKNRRKNMDPVICSSFIYIVTRYATEDAVRIVNWLYYNLNNT
jgi:hypothetical protein